MNKTDFLVTVAIAVVLGMDLVYLGYGLYTIDPFRIAAAGGISIFIVSILLDHGKNLPE